MDQLGVRESRSESQYYFLLDFDNSKVQELNEPHLCNEKKYIFLSPL